MDFFGAQERARRTSALLVFYFLLAVVAIIGAVYGILAVGAYDPQTHPTFWNPDVLLLVAPAVLLLIGGGSAYKIAALAGDGASVAETLGGRLVSRGSEDLLERRLLNVVDEMAIASGVPVPQVYVLEGEHGINAFAAGSSPNEAAVAVTRGTLEKLSRDELQGVIAHEFSHIFNGDMRLNIRLIGVLHGILLLALLGRVVLHGAARSRSRNSGGAFALGLGLLIIGYVGVFFGRLIKAAVSRQREYLADAAAVQYTRNPGGIGGALRKIAGLEDSLIQHPKAEEASHLFFGQGLKFFLGLLATHPPIEERIRRVEPHQATSVPGAAAPAAPAPDAQAIGFASEEAAIPLEPARLAASVGTVDPAHVAYAHTLLANLPEQVTADLHSSAHAKEVVYALLLDPDPVVRTGQLEHLGKEPEAADRAQEHRAWIAAAGPRVRLPLLDLALPSLAELPGPERSPFLNTVDALIAADGKASLFEYVVAAALRRRLLPKEHAHKPSRDLGVLRTDCERLFWSLARTGAVDDAAARAAFDAASARAPFDGPLTPPGGRPEPDRLHASLGRLVASAPRFKAKLIEACAAAVTHDGKVTVAEAELLRAVAERLDAPMPPLLPGMRLD